MGSAEEAFLMVENVWKDTGSCFCAFCEGDVHKGTSFESLDTLEKVPKEM